MAAPVLVDHVREHLIDEEIVRNPETPGPAGRPWLPPAWKHPDNGAVGPGDAKDQGKADTVQDDGLVVSIFRAPGIPPAPGGERRRRDGIDLVLRGRAVPAIDDLEEQIRDALLGRPAYPGGRTDWTMAGLYVISCTQWKDYQPLDAGSGVFTFTVGYLIERPA